MTKRALLIAFVALASACSKQDAKADSAAAALPAVDTMKPATDSVALRDSLGARTAGATGPASTKTQTTGSKTGTKRDSTIIGRDSITPFDPTKKPLPPAKRPN
jgi:hypothetical protein